jgi:ketosteroid isomerase-like protein
VADIVARYLHAIASQDWDVVGECIADDIVRVGPYGDRYAMTLGRVTYASDALAYVELSETVDVDGKPMRTPEVLVFELGADGRIARVEVYIQTPAG